MSHIFVSVKKAKFVPFIKRHRWWGRKGVMESKQLMFICFMLLFLGGGCTSYATLAEMQVEGKQCDVFLVEMAQYKQHFKSLPGRFALGWWRVQRDNSPEKHFTLECRPGDSELNVNPRTKDDCLILQRHKGSKDPWEPTLGQHSWDRHAAIRHAWNVEEMFPGLEYWVLCLDKVAS